MGFQGVKVDEDKKKQAIKDWQTPTTFTKVKGFPYISNLLLKVCQRLQQNCFCFE